MSNIAAARAEIQKVVSLLVNRFGHEEDVFKHLTLALAHLREERPAVVIETAEVATESVAEAVVEEAEQSPLPSPRRPSRPASRNRPR